MNTFSFTADAKSSFAGLEFRGKEILKEFYTIVCPCGVKKTYALNQLPEVDTPMGCGNPNHYAVRYLP